MVEFSPDKCVESPLELANSSLEDKALITGRIPSPDQCAKTNTKAGADVADVADDAIVNTPISQRSGSAHGPEHLSSQIHWQKESNMRQHSSPQVQRLCNLFDQIHFAKKESYAHFARVNELLSPQRKPENVRYDSEKYKGPGLKLKSQSESHKIETDALNSKASSLCVCIYHDSNEDDPLEKTMINMQQQDSSPCISQQESSPSVSTLTRQQQHRSLPLSSPFTSSIEITEQAAPDNRRTVEDLRKVCEKCASKLNSIDINRSPVKNTLESLKQAQTQAQTISTYKIKARTDSEKSTGTSPYKELYSTLQEATDLALHDQSKAASEVLPTRQDYIGIVKNDGTNQNIVPNYATKPASNAQNLTRDSARSVSSEWVQIGQDMDSKFLTERAQYSEHEQAMAQALSQSPKLKQEIEQAPSPLPELKQENISNRIEHDQVLVGVQRTEVKIVGTSFTKTQINDEENHQVQPQTPTNIKQTMAIEEAERAGSKGSSGLSDRTDPENCAESKDCKYLEDLDDMINSADSSNSTNYEKIYRKLNQPPQTPQVVIDRMSNALNWEKRHYVALSRIDREYRSDPQKDHAIISKFYARFPEKAEMAHSDVLDCLLAIRATRLERESKSKQ